MDFLNYLVSSIDDDTIFLIIYSFSMIIPSIISFVYFFVDYILVGIALYNMAFLAGYDYPFLAFIPFARFYLMHILPIKEYNFVGMYKNVNRAAGFGLFMAIQYVIPVVLYVVMICVGLIPFLGYLILLFFYLVWMVLSVFMCIARAVMRIDLLETYMPNSKGGAIGLGVGSIFVRPIYTISLLVLCRKEPEYGFGNYYNPVKEVEE